MPLSTSDGRQWVLDRLAQTTVPMVVDGGAGMGTYVILGRHIRWDAHWTGVEIHEPYVQRFLLDHLYDEVIISDLREYKGPDQPYVILLGDVLEHMQREDAVDVLTYHLTRAEEIMVSVPIIHSPQEACFGNEHEAHLYDWDFDEMTGLLPGCDSFRGVEVGRWWWKREDNQ